MSSLSVQELDGLLKTFPLYVHFDKSLWPEIKRAELEDEEGSAIFKHLSERYRKEAFAVDQDEKMKNFQKVSGSIGCASNELDSIRVSIQ